MSRPRHPVLGILGLSGLLVLTGCFGPPAPTPTGSSAAPAPTASASGTTGPSTTATPTTAPATTAPAGTPAAPTTGAAAPPSSAPASPPATEEPQPTGLPEQTGPLTVYYIGAGYGGPGPTTGCGDSVVPITTAPVRFTDQVRPSIEALLANKNYTLGESGYVNTLYQSNLTYVAGELTGSTITIWLTGQFMLGGVCDIPRAKAQLEYTAMAASGATSAQVFVNGRPLDEVLSLK